MALVYEDLTERQFEDLVIELMRKLFGVGVSAFALGKDGGRDARFVGTAESYPSKTSPWTGTTIGQAKHTNDTNAHYSDTKFSGDAGSAILNQEVGRVAKLREEGEIDNYILFANRRLSGVTGPKLERKFSEATGLQREKVKFHGQEDLDRFLRVFPDVVSLAEIDPVDGPLLTTSDELAAVILAIRDELDSAQDFSTTPPVDRLAFEDKNRQNQMSEEFAKQLERRYLKYTDEIKKFLERPQNYEALANYEGAVEEFDLKIVARRKDYQSFDDVFNYLVDVLVGRDHVLAREKKLFRAMLFYMYWNCDIGSEVGAETK